jgi:ABC-2 type transport system ATP-binding protein
VAFLTAEVLSIERSAQAAYADAHAPVLSVRGLSKRFGHKIAISGFDLDVEAGEVVGFVGPNGAGKTTTLRILAGLLKADAGEGQVLGCNILTAHDLVGRRVGYMPQKLALYGELSVVENLRFRAEVYELDDPRDAVEQAIAGFGLEPFRRQRASSLSGGWARRLQLAAALIHKPRLILLDEPTAGLDAESKQDVWRRVIALAQGGASVVINTHDLAEAEQCRRVALFSAGRVLALGEPHEITEAAPFRAVLVTGAAVQLLATRFESIAGVAATLPQGAKLRVLFAPKALAAIRETARLAGVAIEEAPKRLEDAAFVLVRDAALITPEGRA